MGHASRTVGSAFEQRIKNALTAATQTGIVVWSTHQQPVVALRRRGPTSSPAYVGQSGADFAFILRGGIAGAIEAKSVKGSRLQMSAIQPEQARHLDAVAKNGGLALLAAEFRDEETGIYSAHFVPWASVPWEKVRTAESVTRSALADWAMRPDGSIAALVRTCPSCNGVEPIGPIARCCSGGLPF